MALPAKPRVFLIDQPGATYLLVGSDSRKGLSRAENKRLGTLTQREDRLAQDAVVHEELERLVTVESPSLDHDACARCADAPGTADHIKTGKLRALAVTTAARMPDLPEVPTGTPCRAMKPASGTASPRRKTRRPKSSKG